MATFNTGVFGEMHGRLSTVSFRRTRYGTQIIERATPRNPRTAKQVAQRSRIREVAAIWKSLTVAQASAWRSYAESTTQEPPYNLFLRLSVRFLQANPGSAVPLVPPSRPFCGDDVRPAIEGAPSAVRLLVERGNAPGVVTDVLFQPLESIHRATYESHYRSQGIFTLETGQVLEIPARPGVVAVAIRVIEVATGLATPLFELDRVVVS